MDILQHRAAELLDVLQGDFPAVDEGLGVQRPQRHGACHAEGDAHPLKGFLSGLSRALTEVPRVAMSMALRMAYLI